MGTHTGYKWVSCFQMYIPIYAEIKKKTHNKTAWNNRNREMISFYSRLKMQGGSILTLTVLDSFQYQDTIFDGLFLIHSLHTFHMKLAY